MENKRRYFWKFVPHIHVGYGIGMMENGGLLMVNTEDIPLNCRMPNTLVWVITDGIGYQNVKIEKMNELEIITNKLN